MLSTTLPTIEMGAASTSDWVDISGLINVSIHWVKTAGTNLAIDVSNDATDAVAYVVGITTSDIIAQGGAVRNVLTVAFATPFPEGVRYVRFTTAAATEGSIIIHGMAREGSWRTNAR